MMSEQEILSSNPIRLVIHYSGSFWRLLEIKTQLQPMDSDPPLLSTYRALFDARDRERIDPDAIALTAASDECELPLIDLDRLNVAGHDGRDATEKCKREIVEAASQWGFFQVVNHGVSNELIARVREEQVSVFRRPFAKKATEQLLDFAPDSYRWGTPTASSPDQLSWSEAYHIPLTPSAAPGPTEGATRHIVEEFSTAMSRLAHKLAGILAEGLGEGDQGYIKEKCTCNTCYLRLNRYPPCPIRCGAFGLTPHTDSDFLTILHQDHVGGLQLMQGKRWLTVKPNPHALIINIGDLFQAWSNNMYKSVEHRVMSNAKLERFSVAYFLCPSYDTVIQSYAEPAIYRKFSFGEYREQIKEDVRLMGRKIGLTRFLAVQSL
ncbi:gibberellin 2-beta-dioxygenase 8-like isoform X2 [Ananas comosus]|uniref:Gibberellin 2-beta-dioxygenase 8-like isoform X2 n=1 Tax=Ananas comosus TaxID=4615 RepID=A0A6P5F6J6_ANACO|nr:gibberellin 2-beta-dioxygenase 8-like isoform X2 [Ananas comosus]